MGRIRETAVWLLNHHISNSNEISAANWLDHVYPVAFGIKE